MNDIGESASSRYTSVCSEVLLLVLFFIARWAIGIGGDRVQRFLVLQTIVFFCGTYMRAEGE